MRIRPRQPRRPAVNTGVDPLPVRSSVPDKTIVPADVSNLQHKLVVFHHHGIFEPFLGDVGAHVKESVVRLPSAAHWART